MFSGHAHSQHCPQTSVILCWPPASKAKPWFLNIFQWIIANEAYAVIRCIWANAKIKLQYMYSSNLNIYECNVSSTKRPKPSAHFCLAKAIYATFSIKV